VIDHVSIAVRDLDRAAAFYEAVLAALGYAKLEVRPNTIAFGKKYSEFWLNRRSDMQPLPAGSGAHVALRAASRGAVDAFHAAALRAGGVSDGAPGLRPQHGEGYYAAFIRDRDGNCVEAVTFLR
jgi:catechol 2,3-dioxygenase-like lactoylglutathione lyase family enzyme